MDTNKANEHTQPHTETEALIRQLEQRLSDKIDHKFDELKTELQKEIPGEQSIKKMIKEELTAYTPTEAMQRMFGGFAGSLNQNFNTFKNEMNATVTTMGDTFIKFSSHTEAILGRLRYDLDEMGRQSDDNKQAIGVFKANQEALLTMVTRVDNAIRGDGDKNGLVGQVATTKLDVERIASDQSSMRADLAQLTTVSTENARLHQEQLKREERRQKERDAMIQNFKQSAWYVATRGIAWAVGTGAVGTTLVALGQALIGQ